MGLIVGTVRKTPAGVTVQVRLIEVAQRPDRAGQGIQRHIEEPAAVCAHRVGRDSSAAAQSQGCRADEARVHVGSRRRTDERAGCRSWHLQHLHVRLRRRQSDCASPSPDRSTLRRRGRPTATRIAYTSYRSDFQDILIQFIYEGACLQTDGRLAGEAEFSAGVVARRHPARVHVEPRRQQRDLRRQSRRDRAPAADESSEHRRDADLVADRQSDRVHVRSHRFAANLDHERRRIGAAANHERIELRSPDLVDLSEQRDCLRVPRRRGLRHQDL